jgi:hypothetical protein
MTGEKLRQLIHEVVLAVTSRSDVQRHTAAQSAGLTRPNVGEGFPRVVTPGVGFVALGGSVTSMEKMGHVRYSVLPGSEFSPANQHTGAGKPRRSPEPAQWTKTVLEQQQGGDAPFVRTRPADYPGLAGALSSIAATTGRTDSQLARDIGEFTRSGHLPVDLEPYEKQIQDFQYLLFGTESRRRPDNIAYSMMTLRQIERGTGDFSTAFAGFEKRTGSGGGGEHPMSMKGAEAAALDLNTEPRNAPPEVRSSGGRELARREAAMAESWLRSELAGKEPDFRSDEDAKAFIEARLLEFFGMSSTSP